MTEDLLVSSTTTIEDKKDKEEEYTSATKRGECSNEGCENKRRHGSAYCQECSDKHNE